MKKLEDIIRRPIITEKSTLLRDRGDHYMFEVDLRANKQEIKEAVSRLLGVEVLSVNTMVMAGRNKRFGRFMGRKGKWKRAIVTLPKGQSIDFFDVSDEFSEVSE